GSQSVKSQALLSGFFVGYYYFFIFSRIESFRSLYFLMFRYISYLSDYIALLALISIDTKTNSL
ncbi:hypothetical protein, partial [Aquimarina sediminis]|uniref:hypothetical protein n=1 Tax=Aquimarina sediminis TaxID=2070536 RepID=UPI0019D4C75A